MEELRVLVADYDDASREALGAEIRNEAGMHLCAVTDNGRELMELIHREKPDLVVMDLVLPWIDGISVMEALQKDTVMEMKPIILVLTKINNETMIQAAFAVGASYYILKPYDVRSVVERIRTIGTNKVVREPYLMTIPNSTVTPLEKRLDVEIDRRISEAGIPHHIKGYRYLNTAIHLCIEDMDKLNGVTKDLYPSIAKEHNTTSSRVERAIRHAIEVACSRALPDSNSELYQYLITPDGHRPTNSEFIAFMSDRIRLDGYSA